MNDVELLREKTAELRHHCDLYYNLNAPMISDSEYDKLFDELKELENKTGIVLSNSPSITVGHPVKSNLKKVKHDIPLLSFDKTKDINSLIKFIGTHDCLLMYKYDGLTVELIYNKGELVQASTRGDGYMGEDITHNAKTFKNIPLVIPYEGFLRIAGEAIIYQYDFQKINDNLPDGEKSYANARNLAAGSVRQLDSSICNERNIHFMLWDVLEGLDDLPTLYDLSKTSDSRKVKFLACERLGFELPYVCYFKYKNSSVFNIQNAIEHMKNQAIEKGIPIDGIVLKYDSISYSKQRGSTSHHNNDGIAFKFEDEIVESELQNIEWSLGRTNELTPIAVFTPVEIDGTIVQRASLSNISIMEKYLGQTPFIGQKVFISKRNMIIPKIEYAKDKNGEIIHV